MKHRTQLVPTANRHAAPNAFLRVSACLLAIFTSACTESVTDPSRLFAGTWRGSVTDTIAGTGSLELTIQPGQYPADLSGIWTATYGNAADSDGGTLSGKTSGNSASVFMVSSHPCPAGSPTTAARVYVGGLTSAGSHITGHYATFTCGMAAQEGTFDLTQ
jgi:hypothetical protein